MSNIPAADDALPIAVIGSGPTGLTLANLLGAFGVRVLLIERNPSTVAQPRAVSIDDESLRVMQSVGVIEALMPDIVPGYGSHYFAPNGRCFAVVQPSGMPYGYPRRNAFHQPVLEAKLRDNLARFATVRTTFGWRLEKFVEGPESVTAVLADGSGAKREERCAYLVGCDGASSTVREQLGIPLEGTTFEERWLIIDLENQENPQKHTSVFCDPRRPCIALPGPHRTRRYEFKFHKDEPDEALLDDQVILDLLARHGASSDATIRRQAVYRFHARVAPARRRGRVFLAGDAAHLTPPFAGQGMNSGIRDAHNLAWKLAAVGHGRVGAGLLASYEVERRGHVWSMIRLALAMGRVMGPSSAAAGLLTRGCFDLLRLFPPAARYVLEMRYKPKPRFSRGFLLPRTRAGRQLHGRLFPQGRVRTHDGRSVLLDEVLGRGFALLALTGDPQAIFGGWAQTLRQELAIVCVAVLPRATPGTAVPGVTLVHDDGSLAQALRGAPGAIHLLRPDRYVAGTFMPAEAPGIPGVIKRWLAEATGVTR